MNRIYLFSIGLLLVACGQSVTTEVEDAPVQPPTNALTDAYELITPEEQDALLILFPCFPCDAENTKSEFNIVEVAKENNVAVLLMNFNQHLWLSEEEKHQLEETILEAVTTNHIKTENTFIGGFSSGGNVSLLLTDYLKSTKSEIQPKGVFIADSPIDLMGLYENAKDNIKKNFAEAAVQESTWIVGLFDETFGIGDTSWANYAKKSPYLSRTHTISNLSHLESVNIRFYSEPDTTWWKENRQTEYEGMNAYYIEQLYADLRKRYGNEQVEYVKTENRGYRSNGERHPHSWAIIEEGELLNWME